jgi:hypothetical protein
MTMDRLLFDRYATLFRAYGSRDLRFLFRNFTLDARDFGALAYVKRRLAEELEKGNLRPDAALFLLTSYDQMILRAYAVEIRVPGRPDRLPPHHLGRDPGDLMYRVEQSLSLILEQARRRRVDAVRRQAPDDEMLSSHEVLQAIDAVWPQLSDTFGWG